MYVGVAKIEPSNARMVDSMCSLAELLSDCKLQASCEEAGAKVSEKMLASSRALELLPSATA